MPRLTIINNSGNHALLADPDNTVHNYRIAPGATLDVEADVEFLEAIKDQLDGYRLKLTEEGLPAFNIDISFSPSESGSYDYALADTTVWTANHVGFGLEVVDPSTASVVAARRVDHAAGEVYVGGKFFRAGAGTDIVGDAEIDVDGVDVSAVDLGDDEDVYQYFLLVNNGGTLEKVFVRGSAAGAGVAVELERPALASAVGAYLGLDSASYAFVVAGVILFSEDGGLSQTTEDFRWVPESYL